mgnify:CR=1 FL=1
MGTKTTDLQLALPGFTAKGWQPPDNLSRAVWKRVGAALGAIGQGVQWAIGDWVNAGEAAFGEDYAQDVEEAGYELDTIRHLKYVAAKFDVKRRRIGRLPWSFHRSVASLTEPQADKLLDKAEKNDWNRRQLDEAVRKLKELGGDDPDGDDDSDASECASHECRKCGAEWTGAKRKRTKAPKLLPRSHAKH